MGTHLLLNFEYDEMKTEDIPMNSRIQRSLKELPALEISTALPLSPSEQPRGFCPGGCIPAKVVGDLGPHVPRRAAAVEGADRSLRTREMR